MQRFSAMQQPSHRADRRLVHIAAGLGRRAASAPAGVRATDAVVAFVSDEDFSALPGVAVCIQAGDGAGGGFRLDTVSMADGAVLAALPALEGAFTVTLSRDGYGAKLATLDRGAGAAPTQLRLLSDGMAGYMHPKWCRGGESAEYCVHSTEPYRLELFRCGAVEQEHVATVGWIDEHGPQTMRQLLPDGDFRRRQSHSAVSCPGPTVIFHII
jgi:hypothetical protein